MRVFFFNTGLQKLVMCGLKNWNRVWGFSKAKVKYGTHRNKILAVVLASIFGGEVPV